MAAGNVTTTTHDEFRPTQWATDTLDYLKESLKISNRIDRAYDTDVREYGQAVTIEQFLDSGEARDKTDNGNEDVVFDTQADAPIVLLIDKQKYKGHNITNLVKVQSKYDLMRKYTKDIGFKLNKAIEIDSIASINAAVTAGGAGFVTGTAASGTFTQVEIGAAAQILMENNVDFNGEDVGDGNEEGVTLAVNPAGWNKIFQNERFSSSDFIDGANGKKVTTSGKVPLMLAGMTVIVSNLIPAGTALAFHSEAATLALQEDVTMWNHKNPRSLSHEVVGSVIYGTRSLRTNVAVRIDYQ